MWNGDTLALVFGETNWVALRTLAKGRFQNNFLPKVGNLAQGGGGGSDLVRFPNPHYVVGWGTEPLHRG